MLLQLSLPAGRALLRNVLVVILHGLNRASVAAGKRERSWLRHFAQRQALGRRYSTVLAQAQALSYVDVYWLTAVTCAPMFLLSFLLEKNEPGAGGDVLMH